MASLTNVPDEARHRDTAVLDLRFAQEADGRRIRVAPELATRQVERVIEAEGRVQLRTPTIQLSSNVAIATALSGRSLQHRPPAPAPPDPSPSLYTGATSEHPGACRQRTALASACEHKQKQTGERSAHRQRARARRFTWPPDSEGRSRPSGR